MTSPIPRCDLEVRKVKVTFRSLIRALKPLDLIDGPSTKLQLHQHEFDADTRDGSPILSTETPFECFLCRHEWGWLKGFPGKDFNYGWRFAIEELES